MFWLWNLPDGAALCTGAAGLDVAGLGTGLEGNLEALDIQGVQGADLQGSEHAWLALDDQQTAPSLSRQTHNVGMQ